MGIRELFGLRKKTYEEEEVREDIKEVMKLIKVSEVNIKRLEDIKERLARVYNDMVKMEKKGESFSQSMIGQIRELARKLRIAEASAGQQVEVESRDILVMDNILKNLEHRVNIKF